MLIHVKVKMLISEYPLNNQKTMISHSSTNITKVQLLR